MYRALRLLARSVCHSRALGSYLASAPGFGGPAVLRIRCPNSARMVSTGRRSPCRPFRGDLQSSAACPKTRGRAGGIPPAAGLAQHRAVRPRRPGGLHCRLLGPGRLLQPGEGASVGAWAGPAAHCRGPARALLALPCSPMAGPFWALWADGSSWRSLPSSRGCGGPQPFGASL